MRDSFITAINTQKSTQDWMDVLTQNLTNIYTPGYREISMNFKTCLDGVMIDDMETNISQGKSIPGTSPENVYLEGKGFFVTRQPDGKTAYTRLGEFIFDGDGYYKSPNGFKVQGYILNDDGEIMASNATKNKDIIATNPDEKDFSMPATTDIRLWMDPSNGKYLGKYDEFEIDTKGILYGKANGGKVKVPLYKIAVANFNNASALTEIGKGYFVENSASGSPLVGSAEIRSGLIEKSNVDFQNNIAYYEQAKMQLSMTNKLVETNKQLLQEVIRLVSS